MYHSDAAVSNMDIGRVRADFPALGNEVDGKPPIYLDSACQTLRPRTVLDAMAEYYECYPSCAGRSVHRFATEVSVRCDDVRSRAASFFGCRDSSQVVFMKNATEALNTVVMGLDTEPGSEIVTTDYEHNSLHVPVLRARDRSGLTHRIVPSSETGTFDLEAFHEIMTKKVRLVAMCMTSNVTGYSLPAKEVVDIAHSYGAHVLFDSAQAAPSMRIDMEGLGADFVAVSAHKMLGPSGVGILLAQKDAWECLTPLTVGGHAVTDTSYGSYELLPPPERFETGLQNYSGIIGTGAALEYLESLGLDEIWEHEVRLNKLVTRTLFNVPGISALKPEDPNLRGGIFSFNVAGLSSHDVAVILDNSRGMMLRSGMHCCHPYFRSRGMDGCARASFYVYNTEDEAREFSEAIRELATSFGGRQKR